MSKTITYELNDNVVKKLQDIVGGGSSSGTALISVDRLKEIIPEGAHVNVAKLRELLASKDIDETKITGLTITGITTDGFQNCFGEEVYDSCSVSYYCMSEIFDNLTEEIEAIGRGQNAGFDNVWNISFTNPVETLTDTVLLKMSYMPNEGDGITISITDEELASFITA